MWRLKCNFTKKQRNTVIRKVHWVRKKLITVQLHKLKSLNVHQHSNKSKHGRETSHFPSAFAPSGGGNVGRHPPARLSGRQLQSSCREKQSISQSRDPSPSHHVHTVARQRETMSTSTASRRGRPTTALSFGLKAIGHHQYTFLLINELTDRGSSTIQSCQLRI